jgi:hypothetical protein
MNSSKVKNKILYFLEKSKKIRKNIINDKVIYKADLSCVRKTAKNTMNK